MGRKKNNVLSAEQIAFGFFDEFYVLSTKPFPLKEVRHLLRGVEFPDSADEWTVVRIPSNSGYAVLPWDKNDFLFFD